MAEKRSALIVATSEYEDARLTPLGGPGEDAEALQGVLSSAEIGGFDVQLALNVPHTELRTTLEAFFADRGREDLLLVHFSGHGLKDDDGLLYLAAKDTKIDRLMSTGVEAGWVNRLMTRCRSEKIALFLDCCFGGAFTTGLARRAGVDTAGVKETFTGTGRFVITASDAMQYSFESGQRVEGAEPQPSPFTSALVQGLRTGEADRNEDGYVSINELYDYLEDRVRQLSPAQTPTKSAFNQVGDWVIAQSLRAPTIRILPVSLQAQLKSDAAAERTAAAFLLRDLIKAADPRVGEAARKALERLTGDDSKFVSDTAARLFGELPDHPGGDAGPMITEGTLPFTPMPTAELSPEARAAIDAMAATATTPPAANVTPPQAQPAQRTESPSISPPDPEPGYAKPAHQPAVRRDPPLEAAPAQMAATAANIAPATLAPPPPVAPSVPRAADPGAGAALANTAPPPQARAGDALWGPSPAPARPAPAPSGAGGALWAPGAGPAPRSAASAGSGKAAADNPARPGRAAGRAAVGSIAAVFLQSFWIGAEDSFLLDDLPFIAAFGLFIGLFFIGAVVLAAVVEASFPALRVPRGSAYRFVGGNRLFAAGVLGALIGLTVGIVAEIVALEDKFAYNSGTSVAIVVCSAIGFAIAEAIVGRREDARAGAGA